MKKITIGTVLIAVIIAYSYFMKNSNQTTGVLSKPTNKSSNSSSNKSQTAQSGYKDGNYTGDVVDAFYGNIQVQTTINQGKITDIQLLQFPNKDGHSTEISNQSLPQLKQEAIQTQGTRVDTISGATQTSQAFVQSLQSGLSKAKS